MFDFSEEQRGVLKKDGNVYVTACPGSGKTRVLVGRVLKGLAELKSSKERVAAVTFTNRVAEEIQRRLGEASIDTSQLWIGTVHSFALEWIVRPYAGCSDALRYGFQIADERICRETLDSLKRKAGLGIFDDVNTSLRRDGAPTESNSSRVPISVEYHRSLEGRGLIDFDRLLFLAYSLLVERPEIASTLAAIFRLICIDEFQDTQDLQYAILGRLSVASNGKCKVFVVGDPEQCIFSTLGAVCRSRTEIAAEFGVGAFEPATLSDCYRSTQRLVDYFSHYRADGARMRSKAEHANEPGTIAWCNQRLDKDALAKRIGAVVRDRLASGVDPSKIAVVAPQRPLLSTVAKGLIVELPGVPLDAPGALPFPAKNVWWRLATLVLVEPSVAALHWRIRLSNELVRDLTTMLGATPLPGHDPGWELLRRCNDARMGEWKTASEFLRHSVEKVCASLAADPLRDARRCGEFEEFLEAAAKALVDSNMPDVVASLRAFLHNNTGVVLSTIHGAKGEEYDTVVAFGLLEGYLPHWDQVLAGRQVADPHAQKLLHVLCSRAKRHLFLISESGRSTKRGKAYSTTPTLEEHDYAYDAWIAS